ncbi:MAG: protein-L-isoaspartate(D-aspartate) O-methyltransferase [Candidatus Berkiellales bacterium]
MSERDELIQELKRQGINHPKVLQVMQAMPRDKFVLPVYKKSAYDNRALPIHCQQTISQPYVVALMTQALLENVTATEKVLEIGTGSGYQAAILSKLFEHVWTIERIKTLHHDAKKTITKLGIHNIHYSLADGSLGWPDKAPFDGILVTAAANTVPSQLLNQLKPDGGVLIIPIGGPHQVQKLTLIKRQGEEFETSVLELVSFVPLIANTDSH